MSPYRRPISPEDIQVGIEAEDPLFPGDLVRVRGQGVVLTVDGMRGGLVDVCWFDVNRHLHRAVFPREVLLRRALPAAIGFVPPPVEVPA
jgi:hypothetical protein